MKLEELLTTCAESTTDDWNAIGCWGARSGPSYLDQFIPATTQDGFVLQHRDHSHRAAYRPDVSISIGFGLDPDSLFPDEPRELAKASFAEPFPDTSWSFHFCDFFYCGNLVERKAYVAVDGGRVMLPLPDNDNTVTQWEHDWFRILDSLQGYTSDYGSYFRRAGLTIR